ncbi:Ig-like domain-containing protein [Xenorhabdus sp. XENO-1]|uniref:Ig-like domain-containing protein n=1 Tax=Xenorhabdus bovienii TaxID=40576 RepID=UPI0020CA6A69|nr:Ig-like domain-containing protein [Xenorhabdus bovienii]MCP9270256.1 Ig-like domain-containing protein [Xenorhabdus bovienii subsp. africana]
MLIKKNKLAAPLLPQSYDGIIDESKLDQSIFVVKVEQYESINNGDVIIVHLNQYLSSIPYPITNENSHSPDYEITIPFSTIPLGSYNVFYTITDSAGNPSDSAINSFTMIKSDPSPPPVIASLKAEVLTRGMPANDYTPNVVLITALDEKTKPVSGTPICIVSNDDICITPSSGVTNQDGQVVFCVTSDADGILSIQVTSGDIKDKVELYFSPVNEAKLIITGSQQIGEEYETITIQVYDKNTIKPIKNSIVYYKIDQAINISNILEIALNSDTIRPMITDEIGQFQINLKGKPGGNCIIKVTANNYVGSVKYSIGQY